MWLFGVALRHSSAIYYAGKCKNVAAFGRFCTASSETHISEDLATLRSRLLYQSKKRGILENDIIIGGFATNYLKELNENQLIAYDKIINSKNYMEWDLYYYFVGRKEAPAELSECGVFKKICTFAHSKKNIG